MESTRASCPGPPATQSRVAGHPRGAAQAPALNAAGFPTHKLPFARVQEGFEMATKRKGECIKIVVDFEEKGLGR